MKNLLSRIGLLMTLQLPAVAGSCQTPATTATPPRVDERAAIRESGLRNEDPSHIEMTVAVRLPEQGVGNWIVMNMRVLKVHKAGRDAERLIAGIDSLNGRMRITEDMVEQGNKQGVSRPDKAPLRLDTLYIAGQLKPIGQGGASMEIIRCKKQ